MSSNGAIANATHRDFDLNFQGRKIWNVINFKRMGAGERFSITPFIEVRRMGPELEQKMRDMTSLEFDICHGMISLRMLYSTTLT